MACTYKLFTEKELALEVERKVPSRRQAFILRFKDVELKTSLQLPNVKSSDEFRI